MRKILMMAVILLSTPYFCKAQTVDEVIAKNVQAHGGMDKLKSVETRRTSGKLNAGSIRVTIVQENKRPDKSARKKLSFKACRRCRHTTCKDRAGR